MRNVNVDQLTAEVFAAFKAAAKDHKNDARAARAVFEAGLISLGYLGTPKETAEAVVEEGVMVAPKHISASSLFRSGVVGPGPLMFDEPGGAA